VDDPEYRRRLGERLRGGELSPAVECVLWYYAKGRPKDEVESAQKVVFTWQRPDWYTKDNIHNQPKPSWLASVKESGLLVGMPGYSRMESPMGSDRKYEREIVAVVRRAGRAA
jgi:hypothetical protein